MLNSTYANTLGKLSVVCSTLTETQIELLKVINSKSRFEQLMAVLPENWEKTHKINYFSNPFTVATNFLNQTTSRPDKKLYERSILHVVVSDKHIASPGRYDEHLKRDTDNPGEWKVYQGLTHLVPSTFHVDHKLIWITKERSVTHDSTISIDDVDYSYSINIYIPSLDTLINAENMKLNNLV